MNHLATKEGVSLQEIEERLAQENEAKRVAEEQKRLEEEERIKKETEAAAEEQRRREARERALYNLDNEVKPIVTAIT